MNIKPFGKAIIFLIVQIKQKLTKQKNQQYSLRAKLIGRQVRKLEVNVKF